jgi:hypothetical protein
MLEGIAFTLVKTFVSHIFGVYLDANLQYLELEEVTQNRELTYVCETAVGRSSASVKYQIVEELEDRLQNALDKSASENFARIRNRDEREIVRNFRHDKNLRKFVKFSVEYKPFLYGNGLFYSSGCIPTQTVLSYTEKRVRQAKIDITLNRSERAFEELETGVSNRGDKLDKVFEELDKL